MMNTVKLLLSISLCMLLTCPQHVFAQCCGGGNIISQVPDEEQEESDWIEEDETPPNANRSANNQPMVPLEAEDDVVGTEIGVNVPITAILSAMEIAKFGKVSKKKGILPRVERLEKKVYGVESYRCWTVDLRDRVSNLIVTIKPTHEQLNEGFAPKTGKNWFLNPPPVPWMTKLGKGIKGAGQSVSISLKESGRTLTSPEFLTLIGAAGALVGAYYLARSNGAFGGTSRGSTYGGRTCFGEANCTACINCNACGNCNHGGRLCGVWYRTRGLYYR